jgi:glycosyltransferase involved in cell wall biosynthesis
MTPGLASVITPVYNGERFLAQALESALAQDYHPIEVVVVDDGSEDTSAAIAERFGQPVRCLRRTHAGQAAAREVGVAASEGEFIAFLDADDLWPPYRLSLQIEKLMAQPEIDGVHGRVMQFRDGEDVQIESEAPRTVPVTSSGTLLIRRSAYLKVGSVRTDLRVGEFIEWYGRALDAKLCFETLDAVVLFRRVHDANLTATLRENPTDYLRAVKATLDRRRGRRN